MHWLVFAGFSVTWNYGTYVPLQAQAYITCNKKRYVTQKKSLSRGRTTAVQIGLRICAARSEPSFSDPDQTAVAQANLGRHGSIYGISQECNSHLYSRFPKSKYILHMMIKDDLPQDVDKEVSLVATLLYLRILLLKSVPESLMPRNLHMSRRVGDMFV